jgi:hypothetical protein
VRSKLADVGAAEGKTQGSLQKTEISPRPAQTESSGARIDPIMLQLRMKAIRNDLIETKTCRDAISDEGLHLDTTHQKAIETIQANFGEKQPQFIVSICECFKELSISLLQFQKTQSVRRSIKF